jgi:hypothetical protein
MTDHKISWREYDEFFNVFVEKSTVVAADMVEKHVQILKYRQWDNVGNQNIVSIKVQKLFDNKS